MRRRPPRSPHSRPPPRAPRPDATRAPRAPTPPRTPRTRVISTGYGCSSTATLGRCADSAVGRRSRRVRSVVAAVQDAFASSTIQRRLGLLGLCFCGVIFVVEPVRVVPSSLVSRGARRGRRVASPRRPGERPRGPHGGRRARFGEAWAEASMAASAARSARSHALARSPSRMARLGRQGGTTPQRIGEVRCAAGWSHTLRDQPLDVRVLRRTRRASWGRPTSAMPTTARRRPFLVVAVEHAAARKPGASRCSSAPS